MKTMYGPIEEFKFHVIKYHFYYLRIREVARKDHIYQELSSQILNAESVNDIICVFVNRMSSNVKKTSENQSEQLAQLFCFRIVDQAFCEVTVCSKHPTLSKIVMISITQREARKIVFLLMKVMHACLEGECYSSRSTDPIHVKTDMSFF